ncbi:uncharacterized protein LOC101743084 isoform X2 [Bombyx mori]|uniref:PDZ domain-containing protein n=1 Tax=Bombyx mori TaxID=7091 RepID=A0A8R2GCB0_BOMMO|nr:uncharacterized protein LOC101743084 isoform X2 [Bombyx mori]
MAGDDESSDSDGPIIDDNVIRIQLKKNSQRKWELRTRNLSPGIRFPTIQLFDCDGNLLVETNDENVSIKSFGENSLKSSQSLREKDFRHVINRNTIRKHNSIAGGKVYTRVYRTPVLISDNDKSDNNRYIVHDSNSIANIPSKLAVNNNFSNLQPNSLDNSPFQSGALSEVSSYKSSDNETCDDLNQIFNSVKEQSRGIAENSAPSASSFNYSSVSSLSEANESANANSFSKENECSLAIHKSKSFSEHAFRDVKQNEVQRSKSSITYKPPRNKVSFLNTYLKSVRARVTPNTNWFTFPRSRTIESKNSSAQLKRCGSPKSNSRTTQPIFKKGESGTDYEFINISTDVAAYCELKKRLKMYRRGVSEIETGQSGFSKRRRHSVGGMIRIARTSSSESVDEADLVLNRLKRRILKNKLREKRRSFGAKFQFNLITSKTDTDSGPSTRRRDEGEGTHVSSRLAMGSNISQHSSKGLKGRRARSSGDLCNGDSKSQTESSVCGSVVGDVMGWNRSLPNHLDGNRHLADYSRVNNNYGDFGTYNRGHPKGGRGLRYRVSKSGSDAEPVWKLQDPGFDQGYASERSPEDDYLPPIAPAVSLEAYEAELRAIYPFITDENSFTVVVEKDGRGLGMSVCGGGGLVRIRRLYPPQPAWRTGRLAPRDLLLSANGVPLAGLSTYEALEVLRTAAQRVELRVCRPPADVLESVTPPEPPTPPARTPHPPHLPPLDPLNCHPMHARLSQTTSSATTSSSEGRGRREASPEQHRRDLRLPDLDRPLPVYDIQYGEFDIVMTKVNGSLGFTLRKEDHSALGHYVRALVREPALSDGRIQPGDRIIAVNDTPMSNMSHAEAVAFLRACGTDVRLRLYRDHAATPLSPMSPKEDGPTDSDTPLNRPKPPLRPEAVTMLCDLAARRLTPDTADGSRSPCLSPRKFRKLTKDNNHYEQPITADAPSANLKIETQNTKCAVSTIQDSGRPNTGPVAAAPHTCRKQKLSLTVPPHGYELNNLDNDTLDAPNLYQENMSKQRYAEFPAESLEPVSMPVISEEARFQHTNPAYQSAVLHGADTVTSEGLNDDGKGLHKWKGVALSPDNERKVKTESIQNQRKPPIVIDAAQKENVKPETTNDVTNTEPTIVTVELNRGWNSRLGFSVQSHPESGQSYISAVYNDSVAARDGRLQRGDVILQVNDENVTSMKTPEVIDLLRILRGSICITVLRPPNP